MSEATESIFERHFNKANLVRVFNDKVFRRSAAGTDGIDTINYQQHLSENIELILRKVANDTFRFSRYKEKLILKGAFKNPRQISIPTVRDKLVMRVLTEILFEAFGDLCHPPPINQTISRLKAGLKNPQFTGYLRLDVVNFYPTVPHLGLLTTVKKRVTEHLTLRLIEKCIKQSVYLSQKNEATVGVPQGLPVSNVLANIYLSPLDESWANKPEFMYARYVDDILILGPIDRIREVSSDVIEEFQTYGLEVHALGNTSGKSQLNLTSVPVEYLGYRLSNTLSTVKAAAVARLKRSLINIVVSYASDKKRGYTKKLLWKLNLRITGCVVNHKRFGWLFFFSEMEDESLLRQLDQFVVKILSRWNVKAVKPKRFTRAYFEIKFRSSSLRYIPRFDILSTEKKREILRTIFGINLSAGVDDKKIDDTFFAKIRAETQSLEEDVVRAS